MEIDISVIVPIYNIDKKYLEKCLLTLLSQNLNNYEIILVNDGSKQYIDDICREYSSRYEQIIYIPIKHQGVSVARNVGVERSRGEFISFVDPDDWVSSYYLETLLNTMKEFDTDIVVTNCTVVYDSRKVINNFLMGKKRLLTKQEKEELILQLLNKKITDYYPSEIAIGVPWAKLFKRNFIIDNSLSFPVGMVRMQDTVFIEYALEKADSVCFVPKNDYYYRVDTHSISHSFNPNIVSYFERFFAETKLFLDINHKEELFYKALQMKELTSFNSYLSYYYFHKDNNNSKEDILTQINNLLEQSPYKEAIDCIDYKLLNLQEKIFVFCLKKRLFNILKLLVYFRQERRKFFLWKI